MQQGKPKTTVNITPVLSARPRNEVSLIFYSSGVYVRRRHA